MTGGLGTAPPDAPAAAPEEIDYRRRTPGSARFLAEARGHLPGGDSRSTLFYRPYPAVFARGEGCRLTDVDGNELLDFTGNHSALVHGYGHARVLEAVRRQLDLGTAFPGATEPQLALARLLTRRLPSLELVRFTNSGTEATLAVLRAVRGFTGRRLVARAARAYHGALEETMASSHPDAITLPFNDPAGAIAAIEAARHELAAVIVEPVQGSAGMIPATADYLRALREVTSRHQVPLVFDEVVSVRVAYGGAQEYFGVRPDLTVLGKLIGGGFPLGAFGGRAEIMALFDPSGGPPAVPHPGSYNANPVSVVAGVATLELLDADAIARINRLGETVRAGLQAACDEAGLSAGVTGVGSLFGLHPSGDPGDAAEIRRRVFLGLYNAGVLVDPRGVGSISTVLGEPEVERLLAAAPVVIRRVQESSRSSNLSMRG